MNLFTVVFAIITVLVHILVFVFESLLWLNPLVHERALSKLNAPTEVGFYEQAQILDVLFFNQGFYNLFVALGGITGLVLYRIGRQREGMALVCNMCLFAFGASVVLASTSVAYIGSGVQGLPPLLALLGLYLGSPNRAA